MTARRIIGVDLGGTNVRSGLVCEKGILNLDSRKIRSQGPCDDVISDVVSSIAAVMSPDVDAIGIGVPAVVDTRQGIVYDVQNIPSWKAVPLKSVLEEQFQRPVHINNDANCFVLGEWFFGRGKGYRNVAGLILGTGVAAGLICNGQLYEGRNCGAGEFGMLPYKEHNLEFYASGNFFTHFHQTSGEELWASGQSGDPHALKIFREYAYHVNWAVRAVLYAVDPDIIILGGSVSKAYPLFKEALWGHLADFPYKPVLKNIAIEQSEMNNIAILGAAALQLGPPGQQ